MSLQATAPKDPPFSNRCVGAADNAGMTNPLLFLLALTADPLLLAELVTLLETCVPIARA